MYYQTYDIMFIMISSILRVSHSFLLVSTAFLWGLIRETDITGTNPEVLTNSWQSKTVSLTLATELTGAIFGL